MNLDTLANGNYRLLIIDDNRAIHDDLRKILAGKSEANSDLLDDESFLFETARPDVATADFKIESAYQGQDGLALVQDSVRRNNPYAMAFVDVRMPPGWDGIETVARLWEVDPQLQIVICTAYSDYSWHQMRTKLGPTDNLLILKKPFDTIEVIQLAHALTRKWTVSHQAQANLKELDAMVTRRTAELQRSNAALQKEVIDRAKAEEAFRTVFEASPVGIALLDSGLRFVTANGAMQYLHGLPRDRFIGNDPLELEWWESRSELTAALGDDLAVNGLDQHSMRLRHSSRGLRDGLLWARSVEIQNRHYVLCFLFDVTEQRRMEEDLRRARVDAEAAAQAKSEFLANMSHEIRTPLNGVLGLTTLLEERLLPDPVRNVGKLIRDSGEILRRVLDDVLDFSKIESGKLDLESETLSLRESLEWSIGIYRKAAEDKQIDLVLDIQDETPDYVRGDSTRLRQILTNLISTAIKFSPCGSVRVSVRADAGNTDPQFCRLSFSVSDSGIGIPADRLDRLFQSFTQVDASTTRRFGGTGLGLAICKRLVKMMGGEISVSSVFGSGATFTFTLPFALPAVKRPAPVEAGLDSTPRHVLVVEDNAINRLVTQSMIERLGHTCDLVNDGASAIRQVQQCRYDLLLMDVNMPLLDGLEATRRIRALAGEEANTPIIALTASALPKDRQDCLDADMNDYLSKPLDLTALRNAIDRWVARPALTQNELVWCK